MKQYSLVVILHICLLAILSVGVYVLYCADLWFSMLITFLFLLGTGIHLYYIQMKQLQMMRRLTDSLRYNDMTQAFRPPYKNKLMTEMAVELSETLQAFRARLLEEEILNLEQLERQAVEKAMRLSEGNMTRAAEYLGITRFALYRKIEKLGL